MAKKVPKQALSRSDNKNVKIISQSSSYDGRPSWRFSSVDRAGPFPWPKGQREELEIVEKLHAFDSMSWNDIAGKQHHFLSPSSLSSEAKRRLEEIQRDDEIDNIFSFHLQGKPRIVCIRHQDLALLLWYDPEHKVAPSTLKNT